MKNPEIVTYLLRGCYGTMSRFTVEFFLVGQANAHANNVTVCFFLTFGQTCTTYRVAKRNATRKREGN